MRSLSGRDFAAHLVEKIENEAALVHGSGLFCARSPQHGEAFAIGMQVKVVGGRDSYARYWNWSNLRTDIFMLERGVESTVFGWQHHLDPSERTDDYLFWSARNRSRNFPMQATCAEILRWACVLATDDGITIHAPVHDAVLIGAPETEIEDAVDRMRKHMIAASRLVLDVEMKVPMPTIIRYPERMRDARGAKVWDEMMQRLDSLNPADQAMARCSD